MKLALLTTRLVDAPGSGGEICTARLLDALTTGAHELRCIGRGTAPPGAGAIGLGAPVRPFDLLPWPRQLADVGMAFLAGEPCTVHRLAGGAASRRAARAVDALTRAGTEALVVDHLQAHAWLRRCTRRLPTLLVMHNLESDGYRQQARLVQGHGPRALLRRRVLQREARLLGSFEAEALARSTVVACLSDDDARRLRALLPHGQAAPPVEVLPGFPSARPLPPPRPAPDGQRRIGLIGTWTWGPNRDALRWMLDAVLPLLPPGCRLVLAGTGLERMTLPARVQSLGRVEHVAPFYEAVDLLALPSLHGSGVQEKAIEAIGTGRPVVATPHALRGLGPLLPQVRQAADAATFAQACAGMPLDAAPGDALAAWTASRRASYEAALARCLDALQAASCGRGVSSKCGSATLLEPPRGAGRAQPGPGGAQ